MTTQAAPGSSRWRCAPQVDAVVAATFTGAGRRRIAWGVEAIGGRRALLTRQLRVRVGSGCQLVTTAVAECSRVSVLVTSRSC
jgi:hypothetical protein